MTLLRNDTIPLDAIRGHYDGLAPFYYRFWGEHIHHGLWENGESLPEAQVKLVEKLAACARIPHGARVLDVGCGFGGSALWLARELGCTVLGMTISPVQVDIARRSAAVAGLSDQVEFEVRDANQLDAMMEDFDVVWTVECAEHLFDKPRFFENCARVLRPDGRLALCTWLADATSVAHAELVDGICQAMLCPSLGSMSDHIGWLRASGFGAIRARDLTRQVEQTWVRAAEISQHPEIALLLRSADESTRAFVRAFSGMRKAYASGAMSYSLFVARKSSRSSEHAAGKTS